MTLSSNIHLSNDSNNRYQFVYASQSYGTFYGVYAQFIVNKDILIGAKFKLVNYKGILNIGLKSVSYIGIADQDIIYEEEEEEEDKIKTRTSINVPCLNFSIKVQAFIKNKERITDKINCNLNDLKKDRNKEYYISVERTLIPFKHNDFLFDTEFRYRDGLRNPYDFSEEYLSYRNDNNTQELKYLEAPGGICPKGISKIIY